jgi:hypothetical protein
MKGRYGPSAAYLPVEPTEPYPLDAIKNAVLAEKFETDRYFFGVGEFQVSVLTPPVIYRVETEATREATKTKNKRTDKNGAIQGTINVLDEFQRLERIRRRLQTCDHAARNPEYGVSHFGERLVAASLHITAFTHKPTIDSRQTFIA